MTGVAVEDISFKLSPEAFELFSVDDEKPCSFEEIDLKFKPGFLEKYFEDD